MERRTFLKKILHWFSYIAGTFAVGFPLFSFITYRKPHERRVVFPSSEQLSGLHFKEGVFLDRQEEKFQALPSKCTHLGCTLHYDVLSAQFRCPCHGSVFNRSGKRLSGPAEKDLEPLPFERLNGGDIVVIERL